VASTLYFNPFKRNKDDNNYFITLYSQYYINEEQVFRDSIHEIVETTLEIILLESLSSNYNIFKVIPFVGHLLTEISLYDGKEPIPIGESKEVFKTIENFLKKLGYDYKYIDIKIK
jgi:hypothetical protein